MHCYRSYMPIITLRGAIVAGVLSRQVAGKNILFFPSNSVRLLMGSSNEDEKISADDIVGLLTHFSVSRAIKDYVAEGMLYHYPQLVIKKRKVNQIIIHMFKSSIVAPLGSHSIMSSKGRTWRPLNALRTSKCCWDSLMGPSCLVSSSAQDKFVLDCANSFMDCELLSREDFGLVALSAIVPVVGPSRRSLGQATTPTTFFSPDRRDTLSVEVTPIQDRQSRLPPMPSVFLAEDLAMPIAAIIELVCSIGDDGGSDMDIDELGLTLRREVDMAFFGISPKNPLNQKTVTTADLGALARRLDSRHNRAGAFEKRDLLASVDASRLKAVTLLKEACVALGTSTSFAPPVDMRLFEYYRVSEPFRDRLDPATTSSRATAPFDFKAERFPAKKQGFAVQKNLDHKAAAILRAIMYETHVSQTQFTLQWSYWHLFFLGAPPDKEDLRSAWTLRMRFQQLDERERLTVVEELMELVSLHQLTRFAYMSDATHFAKGEKLIRELMYPHVPAVHARTLGVGNCGSGGGVECSGSGGNVEEGGPSSDEEQEETGGGDYKASPEKRTPRSHFLSISDTATKGAADTADASLMSVLNIIGEFAVSRLIGGTVDHAALSEIRQLRDAAIKKGITPVAAV